MNWQRYLPRKREGGKYQGPLSTYREYHSTILGLVVGVASVGFGAQWVVPAALGAALGVKGIAKTNRTKALNEIRREPWYFCAGLLIGWFVLGPML